MSHLSVARFAGQARLADDVFQYFKFIEPVADEENVLLGEEEFEKREDVVFRFCATGKPIVCIVSDVIPIRLPTGELTGYLGITEAKLPKEFQLSNVVTFSQEDCLGSVAPRKCGAVLFTCETRTTESCELLIASAH